MSPRRILAGPAALLALLGLVIGGCGGRLTPPTVPPERAELDRLARARDAGRPIDPEQSRRLAVLLDRYDNAPERADLIDAGLDMARARQAIAWRGWARQRPGWAGVVAEAIAADPRDPGSAALAALLHRSSSEARSGVRARLETARDNLRPLTGCLVDSLWSAERLPCAAGTADDRDAVFAALASADPTVDPEADRLRWTLARWGLTPRPAIAAAAAGRWLHHWPRHADGWAMAGASAATDPSATPAERLAWSGAAWQRALEWSSRSARAHLALADLEARHGLPAAAERHRLDASRAVGDGRPLNERWARGPVLPTDEASSQAAYTTAAALRRAAVADEDPAPRVLLDRSVLVLRAGVMPIVETQRLSTDPLPAAAGCTEARIAATDPLYMQRCRAWAIVVQGIVEIPFQTAWATARGEIVVRTPRGTHPVFESHGGAPGAQVSDGPGDRIHTFTLDAIDPAVEGRRRPRVRVRFPDAGGPVTPPVPGMVDRLVAIATPDAPPPVRGDVGRTVARLRAAGIEAEQVWVEAEGKALPLVARSTPGGWRWLDAGGTPWTGPGPIIAATRATWVGRSPSTITRAATGDLPSSSPLNEPQPRRP